MFFLSSTNKQKMKVWENVLWHELCATNFLRVGLIISCGFLLVCVEVLRPSEPNWVMSSAVSLPNHMFSGQAYSSKRLTSIVHILSPEKLAALVRFYLHCCESDPFHGQFRKVDV